MLPESPGRREEGFNKSAMRNKIAAYRSKAVLKLPGINPKLFGDQYIGDAFFVCTP